MIRSIILALALLFAICPQSQAAQPECMVSLEEALQRDGISIPAGILVFEERGQKTITCKGIEYVVPPALVGNAFRYSEDTNQCASSFLIVNENNCKPDSISIGLSASPDCNRARVCAGGSFTMSLIANDMAHDQLMQIMPYFTKAVTVREGVKGYYIEGACYAYCNPNKLIWGLGGRVFTLSDGNEASLIKAANDYIDAARAHEVR